jgi:hypothetical protein
MDARTGAKKLFKFGFVAAAALVSTGLIAGCDQPDAQAAKEETSQDSSAVPAPAGEAKAKAEAPPAPAAASSYKEEAFHLTLTAPESVIAGKATELKVTLTAQSGYKVNDEYPIKFQFADAEGIVPAKQIVRKDDAKLEKKTAEIPLSVTIKTAGKHTISGKLSFSVCTEERCLIEKRDLSLDVNAS